MTDIKVTYDIINDYTIFTFVGELDDSNTDEIFSKIYYDIQDFSKKIIFNFKGLIYLDNKSIGYIADIYSNVEQSGGYFYITNCSTEILDVFELVGIIPLVEYHKDMNEFLGIKNTDIEKKENVEKNDNVEENTLMQKIKNKFTEFKKKQDLIDYFNLVDIHKKGESFIVKNGKKIIFNNYSGTMTIEDNLF